MKIADAYITRCHKTLKAWNAPFADWVCMYTYDIDEDGWLFSGEGAKFTCELCGCVKVRFVHVMRHIDYFEDISVGCVCAGIMEGDIIAATERERLLRNRLNRKKNYLKRKWSFGIGGNSTLRYKNQQITIIRNKFGVDGYGVVYQGKLVLQYKNRRITDFLTAVHAAFDLVDPHEKAVRLCGKSK